MKGRGLIFGLNYESDASARLNGCINDANNVAHFLQTTLNIPTDVFTDDKDPNACSAAGIMQKLYELTAKSYRERLDFVWIHYSGHGSYISDTNRDEVDGYDECLVPVDFRKKGLIPDDIICSVFKCFNPATKVICVFDCCHSATMGDLKYSWEGPSKVTVENILCSINSKIITISGCLDDQTSADAFNIDNNNKYSGALTSCMLAVLREKPTLRSDIFEFINVLRQRLLQLRFQQRPKLCSSFNLAKQKQFF